jgi:hypothetical protein
MGMLGQLAHTGIRERVDQVQRGHQYRQKVREGVGQIRGEGQNSRSILQFYFNAGKTLTFKMMQFIQFKSSKHTKRLLIAGRVRQASSASL